MDASVQNEALPTEKPVVAPEDVIEVIELESDELANFDAINMCPD